MYFSNIFTSAALWRGFSDWQCGFEKSILSGVVASKSNRLTLVSGSDAASREAGVRIRRKYWNTGSSAASICWLEAASSNSSCPMHSPGVSDTESLVKLLYLTKHV